MSTQTLLESYNSNLSGIRTYLITLERVKDMLDNEETLPVIDDKSLNFYEDIQSKVEEEINRVNGILNQEETKRMKA